MSRLNALADRAGVGFMRGLDPTVRYNVMTELWGSVAYGIFFAAALQFIPVVLRRLGATPEMLAVYTAETYLGSLLTSFSIVLMRRRRTKSFAAWCWFIGRLLFMLFAVLNNLYIILIVLAFFWFLEAFPSPAYTRIIQAIYPHSVRGQAMSAVRLGMVAAILIVTPLAGYALDHVGYQVLFPLAGLAGLTATWLFTRLRVDEGTLPPRETRSVSSLWQLAVRDRPFSIHLLAFTVFGIGALLGQPLYPIVQVDRLGLDYTVIGLLSLVQSLTWFLGFILWGRNVDRFGGHWVLRANLAIGFIVPLSYLWATNAWMLLPAFAVQGIMSAGVDLGLINTCIQLAPPAKVVEYAAIQATVVGVRGLISPFIGVALINAGVSPTVIFATGAVLIFFSAVIEGWVQVPLTPEQARARRELLRFRFPRL